jgi:polysaccharide chain length determinant protein (PEP-CTERM system associated)
MIENRELTLDDYLAMLRRRLKVILVPVLLAPLAGFLISYLFSAKYTSEALILVEEQKVPNNYVKPVVTENLMQRIATMQQQLLSNNRLQPLVQRLGLAHNRSADEVIEEIRDNMTIEPVTSDSTGARRRSGQGNDIPGFTLSYTADNPRTAQQLCGELTSMLLEINLRAREQVAQSTTDFLSRQVEAAKNDLDDRDSKLATFKRQYIGQLPGDAENNMKILMALNSQLDANTQNLNRAQQDKAYTESLLSQQLGAWRSSQTATNPQSLEQQLAQLQSQLLTLRARYTDDHPDVIKAKNDIAEVKRKLAEVNAAASKGEDTTQKSAATEPPEIQQLRLQVHQFGEAVAQATRDQKRLQDQIRIYQGRVALSPGVEEQYKQLTRDYDTAQKFYNDLLAKKNESEMATDMERRQQGEQMRLLNPASLPDTPSFPNRLFFAGGGLGAGLAIGLGIALWLELRDKSIRTEQDVLAVLELPMLVALPWVGAEKAEGNKNGGLRVKFSREKKEPVQV